MTNLTDTKFDSEPLDSWAKGFLFGLMGGFVLAIGIVWAILEPIL